MKWKIPPECFHVFNENETVTNVTFLETMKKPHGFFSWVHRKPGAIVVLDNATGHRTSRSVRVSGKINIIDWPAKSPDLIENLWEIMDDYIHVHLRPKNRSELKIAIVKAKDHLLKEGWESVLNTLNSLPTRLQELRDKNGGSIDY